MARTHFACVARHIGLAWSYRSHGVCLRKKTCIVFLNFFKESEFYLLFVNTNYSHGSHSCSPKLVLPAGINRFKLK